MNDAVITLKGLTKNFAGMEKPAIYLKHVPYIVVIQKSSTQRNDYISQRFFFQNLYIY